MAVDPLTWDAYLTATAREVEHIVLYVGAHQLAVKSAQLDTHNPGLLVCTGMNDEEIMIDPGAIVAARPVEGLEGVFVDDD